MSDRPWEDEDAVFWSEREVVADGERVQVPAPPAVQPTPGSVIKEEPPVPHRKYLDGMIRCTRRELLFAYFEVFILGAIFGLLIALAIKLVQ